MNEQSLRAILLRLGIHPAHKSQSGWLDFPCPVAAYTHAKGYDRSPSAGAKINDEGTSSWVCHTCKCHGRISGLIGTMQSYTGTMYPGLMREAELADVMAGYSTDFGDFETVAQAPPPEPLPEEAYGDLYDPVSVSAEAVAYLRRRGISRATAETLSLRWEPSQERILFPVRDREGRLFGFTGRAINNDAKLKIRDYAGLPKRAMILGAERWTQGKPVIVVEGLFAYAHLVEIGVEERANVGAILGSVMTPEKAMILRSFDEPVYLLFDNDDAGDVGLFGRLLPDGSRDLELAAVNQLEEYVPTYVPEWPEGKDDPDQLTRQEVWTILDG